MPDVLKLLAVVCLLAGLVGGINLWPSEYTGRRGAYALPVLWIVWGASTALGFTAMAVALDRLDRLSRAKRPGVERAAPPSTT